MAKRFLDAKPRINIQAGPEVVSPTSAPGAGGVPVGTVIAYAGEVSAGAIPDGWLLCNGAEVERARYPGLFRAIGTLHGEGDGATTFHVPDYRGMFLRGVDGGMERDPDRDSRRPIHRGGASGDRVGSVQPSQFEGSDLEHDVGGLGAPHEPGPPARLTAQLGAARLSPSEAETRPCNAYVHYLVKY